MVNVKDIDDIDPAKEFHSGDKLDRIFAAQKVLMSNYKGKLEDHFYRVFGTKVTVDQSAWDGKVENLHTKEGSFLIKDMIDSTIHELSEAVQAMKNWKTWKTSEIETDTDHWKEEMVDALHFFIEALIFAGVTPEELHDIYFKKNKVNQFRQKSGY